MQEYDVALKLLLQGLATQTLRQVTGTTVTRWLNVELPEIRNTRVDLLGETADGGLLHLELQSTHDPLMALRMAEYCLSVFRQFGRLPRQVLLYVGEAPFRMSRGLAGPDLEFRYHAVDVRDLDGRQLLESPEIGDNIIAILASPRNNEDAVRQVVARIAGLPQEQRGAALSQLLILAGLRKLARQVEREVKKMPILNSILDHEVLGPEFKRGLEEGRGEGRTEGRVEGRTEGQIEAARSILSRQIERRFGSMPKWAQEDVASRSLSELEELSLRILDATDLADLFQGTPK